MVMVDAPKGYFAAAFMEKSRRSTNWMPVSWRIPTQVDVKLAPTSSFLPRSCGLRNGCSPAMMTDSFQQAANTRCFFHVESMGWGTKLMTVLRAGGVTRGQFCHTNSMIWIKKQRIPHESFQCCYNLVLEKPTFGVTFERSGVLAVPKSRITFEVICHLTTGKPAAALNKMNDNTYNSLPSYIFCFTVKRNTPICVPLTRGDALSE
jgi:hypothetical protein